MLLSEKERLEPVLMQSKIFFFANRTAVKKLFNNA